MENLPVPEMQPMLPGNSRRQSQVDHVHFSGAVDLLNTITDGTLSFLPVSWQIVHIILLICACAMSMLSVIAIFLLTKSFSGSCLLYASIGIYSLDENNEKPHVGIRATSNSCTFSFLIVAMSFSFGIIWTFFLSFCLASGKDNLLGVDHPWRIVPPLTLFSFFMFFFMLVVSCMISVGMQHFCDGIKDVLGQNCNDDQEIKFYGENKIIGGYYKNYKKAEIGAWLATVAWLFEFSSLVLRCYLGVDFEKKEKIIAEDEVDDENVNDDSLSE